MKKISVFVTVLFCLASPSSAENYRQFSERHFGGIRAACEIANFFMTDLYSYTTEKAPAFEVFIERSNLNVEKYLAMEASISTALLNFITQEQLEAARSFLSDLQYYQISENISFVIKEHDGNSTSVIVLDVVNGKLTCRKMLASGPIIKDK